jgi:RNA polymerase sigma factor (sigma-70 family)
MIQGQCTKFVHTFFVSAGRRCKLSPSKVKTQGSEVFSHSMLGVLQKTSLAGDKELELVLKEHGKLLRKAIASACPRDLGIQFDDIEQEARIRLWRALRDERPVKNLASYIYRIAVTATIDAIRRVKNRREDHLDAESGEEGQAPVLTTQSGELAAEHSLMLRRVNTVLATFDVDRRRTIQLYLEGLTTQEIADLLEWTEAKARNILYRGLAELRQQLRAEGIEYEAE